jgi:hypothetical protein
VTSGGYTYWLHTPATRGKEREAMEYLAYLVVRTYDGEEVGRVGVSRLDERYVEKVMSGMLRNMRDDCYVDDSEVDNAREALEAM